MQTASIETATGQEPSRTQAAVIAAVRAEQRRIAQMLHDTVCQTLTGTYLQALVAARKLAASGVSEADDVARLTETIHQAVVELQTVAQQLRPESEPTTR